MRPNMATVLAIDDHADSLNVLRLIVNRCGCRALTAETAEAGLALLTSEMPDLIITDHMMPGMNGVEFIRLCRANAKTAALPIILHTALVEKAFIEDAIKKGANEVWTKGDVGMEQI